MMTREDANNLTRENVWRELELLPVWKLRAPAAELVEPALQTANVISPQIAELPKIVEDKQAPTQTLLVLQSDDKKWAFVLPSALTGEAEMLFNNILLALQINKTHIVNIEKSEAKVLLAMGEAAAQQLLNSTESQEILRGKTHTFEHLQVVVSYHPNDLLQHLALKPKMWDDLILANELAST
jgi:uracil-DNA glycosylase